MAQIKTFSYTNPAAAVAKDFDVGFEVARCTTYNSSAGGIYTWNDGMADASSFDVDSGAYSAANGFTPLSQSSNYGAAISAITAANPGVITCGNTAAAGFAAGDTIAVAGVAESGAGSSLNRRTFTIASLTATTITLDQNTTSDAVYVSGGYVSRVSDSSGNAIPQENFSIRGITLGTTVVGGNDAVMTVVCEGKESVT